MSLEETLENAIYPVCLICSKSQASCPGQCWYGRECSDYYWTASELKGAEKRAKETAIILKWDSNAQS